MSSRPSAPPTPPQFVEVFPIRIEALPPLTAYRLKLVGELSAVDLNRLGSRLVTRLRSGFDGVWLWASQRVISDTPPAAMKLLVALDEMRSEQPNVFGWIDSLEEDYAWAAAPEAITDYVLKGRIAALDAEIEAALAKTAYGIKNTLVEREHRVRAWEVDGQPALSLAVVTRLLYEPELQAYADTLKDPDALIGLWAADKLSTASGEIVRIVGKTGDSRERLLKLAQRDGMRDLIAAAPDDALVVRLQVGYQELDYVAPALRLLIRVEDAERFDIKPQMVERALSLQPSMRTQIIKLVSDIVKNARLIDKAYSTAEQPHLFISSRPDVMLRFGGGKARELDPDKLPRDFQALGAHTRLSKYEKQAIRIVVINTLEDDEQVAFFLEALKRAMQREYQFTLDIVRERKVRVVTQSNLESAVRLLSKENADLTLVFLAEDEAEDEDEAVGDRYARTQTIGRGLPCLIVHETTMHRPEAMPDVVMGLIARAGNIPYLLDQPIKVADRIVGLHVIRQQKRDGDLITGITRIYRADGLLLRAYIAASPADEADGFPDELLSKLLPRELIASKRVMLHHDGRLKKELLNALERWSSATKATFMPVEIVRRGIPRLYRLRQNKVEPPEWGSTFRLSDTEAFLVTSFAPADVAPQPLHIRVEPPLTIDQAIQSVMTFSLFHYGALRLPKLPVTIHHADLIEGAVLRGVMPVPLDSSVPFWL
ncbi:MAG: hypothetical protein SF162_02615 [bacterium]|nr:hypothetical protein [bacterium]